MHIASVYHSNLFISNFLIVSITVYFNLRCLSNITTGNYAQTGAVVPAINGLLDILRGHRTQEWQRSRALQEIACECIGNIAGEGEEYREILIKYDAVQVLTNYLLHSLSYCSNNQQLCNNQQLNMQSNPTNISIFSIESQSLSSHINRANTAVWAMSNIARGDTDGAPFFISGKYSQIKKKI